MVESAEQRAKILCISTDEKGQAFLCEAARLGCAGMDVPDKATS
jgi:hypothetical protein